MVTFKNGQFSSEIVPRDLLWLNVKKTSKFLLRFVLVDYSDQKIESLVDEMDDIIDLFESIKKPQDFS